MSTKYLPGHAPRKWPNGVRWTGSEYVVSGPAGGFGCECGVDFTTDDPYGEHELHTYKVTSTLQRRRWTEEEREVSEVEEGLPGV